jgi:hypothetical protein
MGANIHQEVDGTAVVVINGLLRKAEMDALQATAVEVFRSINNVRVLVLLEDFEGWEVNVEWDDMSFFLQYGEHIERMAIVGNPEWEAQMLSFTGAGFRQAPVRFFLPHERDQGRAWLSSRT